MLRHRHDNFHNSREHGADEPTRGGFLNWLRRQLSMLLWSAGGPTPVTILYTHALDERLSGLAAEQRERARKGLGHKAPFGDRRR